MKNNYNDYVFKNNKPVYDFEGMYKNCDDPWNIGKGIDENFSYLLILSLIQNYKTKFKNDNPDILELGSGKGYFSEKLMKLGKLTGYDISQTAVDYAQQKFPEAKFYCRDIKSDFIEIDKNFTKVF